MDDEWTVVGWAQEAGYGRMSGDGWTWHAVFAGPVSPKELAERAGDPFQDGDA